MGPAPTAEELVPHTSGHAPPTMLDTTGRPDVPRQAVVLLLIWCAIEGTLFAFAVHPTMIELISDLSGLELNPIVLLVPLAAFLTIIVAGSFACIQVANDALKVRHIGNVVSNFAAVLAVAVFEVLFLTRVLFDEMTPWLAQQGVTLTERATLALAALLWIGVRGMAWYLLGRSGAPALATVLNRLGQQR